MIRVPGRFLSAALALSLGLLAACDGGDGPTASAPNPPTGVAATPTGPSSVSVTFNAVSGATRYLIQRSPAGGGAFAEVASQAGTSFDDAGLQPATTYQYRVATVAGGDTSAYSAAVSATTSGPGAVNLVTDITADRTLHSDTVYTLGQYVHVANGATLTIEAGTEIRGLPNSALFILRGARIRAMGTAAEPVVFTSAQPAGQRQPGDWGGLIIVGRGRVNRAHPVILEGTGFASANNYEIAYTTPAGETPNNNDDSGELHYVRIEFAGFGPAPNNELNSLTLAAVGRGTDIDHVQAVSGLDDSFEWFGGAVDAKYLVSYNSGDDHFDASEGYVGRNQFMIALQDTILPPRQGQGTLASDPQGIENDGCSGQNCSNGFDSQPLNKPVFANFTLVGLRGTGVTTPASGGRGVVLRRGTGGFYVNGVVARWPVAALSIRDQATADRLASGDLVVRNLLAADNGVMIEEGANQFTVNAQASALAESNAAAASLFASLPAAPTTATLDWTPAAGSAAATGGLDAFTGGLAQAAGNFVTGTAYRGAADPAGADWWAGWTVYVVN